MKIFLLMILSLGRLLADAQIGVNTLTPNSSFEINGSFGLRVSTVASNTTLGSNDGVVLCNSVLPLTITMPPASGINGRIYSIKSINQGVVTINTSGGQLIDGSASIVLAFQYDQVQLISNGSNWFILTMRRNQRSIGEGFGGGIIFYLDASGQHGLIAAPTDQSSGIKWDNGTGALSFASLQTLFGGNTNTHKIADFNFGTFAASLCSNLVLNGYSDWYLPSIGELMMMYRNLHSQGLGSFSVSEFYWSSTEFDISSAWFQTFSTGEQNGDDKFSPLRVRAIRAF